MSAGSKISSWYSDLPSWAKGAVIVGSGVAIYKIGKAILSSDNSGGTTQNLGCGNNLTFTANQYEVFADAIETAIWGTGQLGIFTEDDAAIGAILMQMQTTDDVCRLVKAYGVRTVGLLLEDGGNLVQSVREYLDDDVIQEVNEDYQQKGINWIWV